MKKKMIIYMSKISIGGMEKVLVDMLRLSDLSKQFDVTLYLVYCTSPLYMNMIPKDININLICKNKFNIFGKIYSSIKLMIDIIKTYLSKNKYEISICYTHHHWVLSLLARMSGKKSIAFIHTDLINSRNPKKLNSLLKKMKFNRFNNIVCVSEAAKKSFITIYPDIKDNVFVINNYIDGEEIIKKASQKIDKKIFKKITFVNISRQVEKHKKISRIINASKKLANEGYNFTTILIGNGKDSENYKNLIEKDKLNKYVKLLGRKENPYPYLVNSDALILSSKFEGYGIVLDEARVLGIPIIATDVADAKKITEEGYGILCENSEEGIYSGMKTFLDRGYKIKKKFDYNKFNKNISKSLNDLMDVN